MCGLIANDTKHSMRTIGRWEISASERERLPPSVKLGGGSGELASDSLGHTADHGCSKAQASSAGACKLCGQKWYLLALTRDLGARHGAVGRHRPASTRCA